MRSGRGHYGQGWGHPRVGHGQVHGHIHDGQGLIHMALVEEDKISGIGTSSMDTERIIVELDISILQC